VSNVEDGVLVGGRVKVRRGKEKMNYGVRGGAFGDGVYFFKGF
jgi:hypothetical protein